MSTGSCRSSASRGWTVTDKADVLKALKPCILCGNALPIVRESIDFKDGTTDSLYQVVCPHKGQKPRLWKDLVTAWSKIPQELVDRWNAL